MQPPESILEVELEGSNLRRLPLAREDISRFLAGRGLNALTLMREVPPGTPPLSRHNPLLVTAGLLTGSPAPSAARLHLGARSPLTGYLGSSSIGGTVGPALRSLGLSQLLLRGRAENPVYVYVHGDGQELRDATHLWGLSTREAAQRLQEECKESVMLLIGPAGERQVPIACIVTQKGHAAGRTGLGAVMGSKNVKAIVVRGRPLSWTAGPQAKAAIETYLRKIRSSRLYRELADYGSTASLSWTQHMGMLATRNYREPMFEGVTEIDGRNLVPYVVRSRACHRCPVHCKAEIRVAEGRYPAFSGERPDFEPLVSLGSKVGLADPEAVLYLANLCDWLGLDSVSAGSAIAFAMDLWEHELICCRDTGDLVLRWGDAAVMEILIEQMAAGEGFGGLLGQGVRRAAAVIGRGAERFAMEVKGLELTAFDPRGVYATGLGYAVSNRGGDYTSIYARHEYDVRPERAEELYGDSAAADRLSPVGKAAMVRRSMIVSAVLDAIGLCKVPSLTLVNEYDLQNEANLVSALCGGQTTAEELLLAGERILALERLFNLRFGAGAYEDRLPQVFLDEPLADGPARGSRVDLQPMLTEFYELMGWTAAGVPSRVKLEELGLQAFRAEVGEDPAQAGGRQPL